MHTSSRAVFQTLEKFKEIPRRLILCKDVNMVIASRFLRIAAAESRFCGDGTVGIKFPSLNFNINFYALLSRKCIWDARESPRRTV